MFYRPHKTVLCDVCDDDDCGDGCYKVSDTVTEESGFRSSGLTLLTNFYAIIVVVYLAWLA